MLDCVAEVTRGGSIAAGGGTGGGTAATGRWIAVAGGGIEVAARAESDRAEAVTG